MSKLIKVNGFDTGAGDYQEEEWIRLCSHFGEIVELKANEKVLELGCGAGAFLFCLQQEYNCEIFGIDYSEALIDIARKNLAGNFLVADASQISRMNQTFDLIFMHSVTQYFPSLGYASEVIEEAYRNLAVNGQFGMLDVNDKSKESSYHASRRSKHQKPEEYDLLYSDHPHFFVDKKELSKILERVGFTEIRFYPHIVKTYGNSEFRFNVIAQKK